MALRLPFVRRLSQTLGGGGEKVASWPELDGESRLACKALGRFFVLLQLDLRQES